MMQTKPLITLAGIDQQQEAEAILRNCVHCGFCNAACPTYQLLGDERDGPRGRIYLIKEMLEGATATGKTQLHLDRCLTCLACESACPSGVAYGNLLDIGREMLERQKLRSFSAMLKRRLLNALLPYPKRFAFFYRLARLLAPVMPLKFRRKMIIPYSGPAVCPLEKHSRRVLLLEGCVQLVLAPGINHAAERVLNKFGISAEIAPAAGCCGALSHHCSAQDAGLEFMRANIDAWLPYLDRGIEAIVTTASGCGLMIKDYGQKLKYDTQYRTKAARISASAKDIVEILADQNFADLTLNMAQRLVFQSPCTLQHGQQLNGAVEALLSRLGIQPAPVTNAHLCCGSAGSYSLLQPELAERLLKDKVSSLEQSRPDVIATANIGCLAHIQSMTTIPVRHWVEILDEMLPD